jgi:mono/diheme cytochrome c family protein
MRLITAAGALIVLGVLALAISTTEAQRLSDGRTIFRFDTFGDEQLWTDVLRMPEALATVDPKTALSVGLKVDAEALPKPLVEALKKGAVDLQSPKTTIELLKLNAVVGAKAEITPDGKIARFGVTCAICHSTVDNSFSPGIGKRLDGWANRDLNVGAILALSPVLDDATKKEFRSWGPGKYDPRHHAFDGQKLVPLNSPSLPIVIPSIYGLRNVGFETVTGDGPISYWNAYVGVGQMGGHGSFDDTRIGLKVTQTPDQVTPKLMPLLEYQLSLKTPEPAKGSFDSAAAKRGEQIFRGEGKCASCHRGSAFTDVMNGPSRDMPLLHDPREVGTEAMYATRSATKKYRTTPLRALWQHPPYFHDGSAADLPAVVEHYDRHLKLNMKGDQKKDLVEFLKSL